VSAFRAAPLLAVALLLAAPRMAGAEIKRVPYPEVRVEVAAAVAPEPAFAAFWKGFADIVARRDANALFALVGPIFVWTTQGALTAEFDPGRDALHNFKVVFGFRQPGRDEDGGVENGPYWDALAQFVGDPVFYSASDKTSMICGPLLAEVADPAALEAAQQALAIADDAGTWYFTAGETPVTKAPGDAGAPVARLGKVAFPLLGAYPPGHDGTATHYEVLLPSGGNGWIAATAARPLGNDRLCYAKTRDGRWTIVDFDQGQADE
jgi:hypothetical protein